MLRHRNTSHYSLANNNHRFYRRLLFLYPKRRKISWLQLRNSRPEAGAVRSTATQKRSYSRTVPSRKSGYTSHLQAISPVQKVNGLQNRLQAFGQLKKKARATYRISHSAKPLTNISRDGRLCYLHAQSWITKEPVKKNCRAL